LANVKFDKRRLQGKLQEFVKTVPYDRIARSTVKNIKDLSRSGISPVTNKPFAPLKGITQKHRQYLERFNRTHSKYKFYKSNLTFTGQLLNAITYARFNFKDGVGLSIFVNPTSRKRYKTGNKRRSDKRPQAPPDNSKLGEYMRDGDSSKNRPPRPFLGVSKKQDDKIRNIISRHLRRELNKFNRN
jgi:hypothetical protein